MMGAALIMIAAAVPATTVQQAFDAAEGRARAGDWNGALAGFRALDGRVASVRTRAVIHIRVGECLVSLGRDAEAATAFRTGLETLPGDVGLAGLRASALRALALIEETRFDLPQALTDYRAARDAAPDLTTRLAALAGVVRTGMFVDPAAAVVDADTALAMLTPAKVADKATEKALRAQYLTLKGRALLNAGQPAAAAQILAQALTALGGLTAKLDLNDLTARSDAAIAALRAGNGDKAREYLAYTGAGRHEGGISLGADMDPPACGDDGDPTAPHPEDVAVVQFSIADDGTVGSVQPVFASRPGPMIRSFLEAVSAWSWTPDRIAGVKSFFRVGVRLEMRCSTTVRRPVATDILKSDLDEWMAARKLRPAPESTAAAPAFEALRGEMLLRETTVGRNDPELLPVIAALLDNPVMEQERAGLLAGRGAAIATTAGAPVTAVLWFRIKGSPPPRTSSGTREAYYAGVARSMAELADDPGVTANARALAAIRLIVADADNGARNRDHARATLRAVAADQRLGPRDPLRVAAQVRLASVESAAGDLPAARAAFADSGLSAMECALVDARPAMTHEGFSSAIYPMEALRWGFAGWVRSEFDITADGRPQNVRTIVGYPPFVFGSATATGLKKTRYVQTFRPDGGVGCGGEKLNVRYALP